MRISDLSREVRDDEVRVAATFRFEHADLPERRIVVSGRGSGAADLQPSPDAFLLMGLPLACWVGEPRVTVEGTVCAVLGENLAQAMGLYAAWYDDLRPVRIEPTAGHRAARPTTPRRTALLLSGGVDSLATLRANRDTVPPDHPDAVREALFLIGGNTFDRPGGGRDAQTAPRRRAYTARRRRLQGLADTVGLDLTVLESNARGLYPDWASYRDIGWAAWMLAHAHLLTRRITDVLLSSTGYGPEVPPHGSHPLLDPLYASGALRVHHALPFTRRFDKLARIADWPAALAVLDVCLDMEPQVDGVVNCGRCSKCLRTMLGLLALGRLAEAPTFTANDLTAEQVEAEPIPNVHEALYLEQMLPALEVAGRGDLATAVRRNLRRWHARRRPYRRVMRELGRALRAWRGGSSTETSGA